MKHLTSLLASMGAWLSAGALYALIRFYGTTDLIDWITTDQSTTVLWFVGSCLYGLVFWVSQLLTDAKPLRERSYGFIIAFHSGFLLLMTVVMVLLTRLAAFGLGNIHADQIWPTFLDRLTSKPTLVFLFYVLITASVISFLRQMRRMIGGRVLTELILGKYHQPQQDVRIFMFLDLKSSTQHAETLGHIRYSQLIRDCFNDFTDSALAHKVEIYQYVGDELVLSWRVKSGIEDSNCLLTYFEFQNALKQRSDHYLQKYGLEPQFKAGANIGPVTVSEIGLLKREIAFHGEAIITASRLQACCNDYGKNLLISHGLKQLLSHDTRFNFENLGKLNLKGKSEDIGVFAVTAN